MALTLVCGAECALVTQVTGPTDENAHWRSVTGAPTIETSVVRTGARSYRFAAAATRPYLSRYMPASQTYAYAMFYVRFTDATPASDWKIMTIPLTAGSGFALDLLTTGVLRASFGATTVSGPTFANDTWYGIEVEVNVSANPNVAKWRTWDGATWTAQTNVSIAQAATTFTTGGINIGEVAAGPTATDSMYLDDIAFGWGTSSTDYPASRTTLGTKVLRYLPNADGVHSSFTAGDFKYDNSTNVTNSDTSVYTYVDDSDQTGTADYISQNVAGAGKYIRIAFANEGTETDLRAANFVIHASSTTAGVSEQHMRVSDDGTNWTNLYGDWSATGYDASYGLVLVALDKVLETKPSGGAWTQGTLNSIELEWGNSDDVAPIPTLQSVSIEALWNEVATSVMTDPMGAMGFFGV